jgi:hypothetical protein
MGGPPASRTWGSISGLARGARSFFIVHLVCAGRSRYVENEVGRFTGSKILITQRDACVWDVQADRNWSIIPQ